MNGCSTGAPPTTRPRAANAVLRASCSRCCSTSREKKRLWEAIKSARLHRRAVTSMSFPHPLMTTRAARIAIPCCSTYRHGHEQRLTRAETSSKLGEISTTFEAKLTKSARRVEIDHPGPEWYIG